MSQRTSGRKSRAANGSRAMMQMIGLIRAASNETERGVIPVHAAAGQSYLHDPHETHGTFRYGLRHQFLLSRWGDAGLVGFDSVFAPIVVRAPGLLGQRAPRRRFRDDRPRAQVPGEEFRKLRQIGVICLSTETALTNRPNFGIRVNGGRPAPDRLAYKSAWTASTRRECRRSCPAVPADEAALSGQVRLCRSVERPAGGDRGKPGSRTGMTLGLERLARA